jgi:hypothetical protein
MAQMKSIIAINVRFEGFFLSREYEFLLELNCRPAVREPYCCVGTAPVAYDPLPAGVLIPPATGDPYCWGIIPGAVIPPVVEPYD